MGQCMQEYYTAVFHRICVALIASTNSLMLLIQLRAQKVVVRPQTPTPALALALAVMVLKSIVWIYFVDILCQLKIVVLSLSNE